MGPSARGWGGLGKSCLLHLVSVAFIQVEISRGCWSPCLELGDRAELVLSTEVTMTAWSRLGSSGQGGRHKAR